MGDVSDIMQGRGEALESRRVASLARRRSMAVRDTEGSIEETDAKPGVISDAGPIQLTEHHLDPAQAADPRLVVHGQPDSVRASRFRVLQHHLRDRGGSQVVVVTSPNRGEGKTTCAVNLALALAECGQARVLLLEAVVRQPQLATIFGFVPPRCFAEQIAAHRRVSREPWQLVAMPDMWIHVAAVSPEPPNAAPEWGSRRLVDGLAFTAAIERMRAAGYEHIVIDAPGILDSAEVNLIQGAADCVIITCRVGRTTARDVQLAVEQLGSAKLLGTVLMES